MQKIEYYYTYSNQFLTEEEIVSFEDDIQKANDVLNGKKGAFSNSLGWVKFNSSRDNELLDSLIAKAEVFREKADYLLCVGIGGSYLGAKAGIDFICPNFDEKRTKKVLFCGHQLNSDYLFDVLDLLDDKEVVVNVISKSGTNTEPSVSFRVIKKWMEDKYGKSESANRIIATTDARKGALKQLAKVEGYDTFVIPQDIGGRFSVLTPVGLFPFAFAGIDITKVILGAKEAMQHTKINNFEDNIAMQYAVLRNIFFRRGKVIEGFSVFQPQVHFLGEWWKQLAAESEGKHFSGIFPSLLEFTTDLHSLGQWMQEGFRNIFETFVMLKNTNHKIEIPSQTDDLDSFNYLSGNTMEQINMQAFRGTILAHLDGGVPVTAFTLEDRSEETLGQFFYIFQRAISLSALLMRMNPFDQPGVEAYKKNMFSLLGRPGYEKHRQLIENKLRKYGL